MQPLSLTRVWETEGIPYEDWRESIMQWLLAERESGKDLPTMASALAERWPDMVTNFYLWYVKETFYRWDNHLKKYKPGKKGRKRGVRQRGVLALYSIFGRWADAFGYSHGSWTVGRVRDALRRYDNTHVTRKTIRRMLRELDFYWDERGGWTVSEPWRGTPFRDVFDWTELVKQLREYEDKLVLNKINQTPPDRTLIAESRK